MKTKAHSPPSSSKEKAEDSYAPQQASQPCLASAYPRLAKAGFPRKFIRSTILPAWVCKEAEKDPDVFPELALFLGKALGISSRSLTDPSLPIIFSNTSLAKFKLASGTSPADERINAAKTINQQIALDVEACLPNESLFAANTLGPIEIRRYILESSKKIDFKSLSAYCWHLGIPVLPAVDLQSKTALNFAGMITWQKDRPFIFLRGNARYSSWGLFILAHELGHLALEHVKQGDSLLEESCEPNNISEEEAAANQWALKLILGDNQDAMSDVSSRETRITAKYLAARANKEQSEIGVDAGFLILKSTWERSSKTHDQNIRKIIWSTAGAALKEPSINNEPTKQLMLDALRVKGNLSALSAEKRELLVRSLKMDK